MITPLSREPLVIRGNPSMPGGWVQGHHPRRDERGLISRRRTPLRLFRPVWACVRLGILRPAELPEGVVSAEHAFSPSMRFALAKFRPMALPATMVARPALHDRLTAGAGKRLTIVVG